MVDGIQRIYDGRRDPSAQRDDSKSEQAMQCMDLQHCLHWLHLGPTHQHRPTGPPTDEPRDVFRVERYPRLRQQDARRVERRKTEADASAGGVQGIWCVCGGGGEGGYDPTDM
jgi:hypothetical protein